jgi:hypothetical protein
MFALVVTVRIDPARAEEARANLDSTVVPRVKESGARSGYWLEPDGSGQGLSVILYDTQEQAEAMLPMIPEEPGPGVKRQSVEVREVVAGF